MTGLYNLVETQLFTKQVTEIGDIRHIDEMLGAEAWSLTHQPERYPVVPGTNGVRLLKLTDRFMEPPVLRVWFRVAREGVVLLSIERIPDPS